MDMYRVLDTVEKVWFSLAKAVEKTGHRNRLFGCVIVKVNSSGGDAIRHASPAGLRCRVLLGMVGEGFAYCDH